MDFLSKKALLMSLRNWQLGEFASIDHAKEYDVIEKIISSIEDGNFSCYIKCSDKLPADGQNVIFSTIDKAVSYGLYTNRYGQERREGIIHDNGKFTHISDVYAWMSMPEPY